MRWPSSSYWNPSLREMSEMGERLRKLCQELVELGCTASDAARTIKWGGVEFTIPDTLDDGKKFSLHFRAPNKRGSAVRYEIGSYPHAKSFPEPKAGFDAHRVIERVIDIDKKTSAAQAANAAKERERRSFDKIQESLYKEHGDIRGVDFKSGKMTGRGWYDCAPFMTIADITPDEATEIAAILRKHRAS